MREVRGEDSLAAQAFLYAGGELEGAEAEAFEARLAGDQAARDALCLAVQLNSELVGLTGMAPNLAYRDAVRARLTSPTATAKARYRGHPALWAALGAAAAAVVIVVLFQPKANPLVAPARVPTLTVVPVPPMPSVAVEADAGEEAVVWSELHNGDHLARARDDEQRRRTRNEIRPRRTSEKRLSRLLSPIRTSMN